MRIPRDVSSDELIGCLEAFGYKVTRQTGSHIRLTLIGKKEHHVTIPFHNPLKIGTLNNILNDVANHLSISKSELIDKIWG